jgi:prepilin-type N-terminal cleavage/methylation domain-containing protein
VAILYLVKRNPESGVTLLEIMAVVAIIGVLAKVVLPMFLTQSRKAQADTEVAVFFAELQAKEESYKMDKGVYLSTSGSEGTTWPATLTSGTQTVLPIPATWSTLRVLTPQTTARCGYVVIAGTKGQPAGAIASGSFAYTPPPMNWFYILAHCNLDDNAAVDSFYFTSSTDASIKKINYGK